jgi:hypothetical protein
MFFFSLFAVFFPQNPFQDLATKGSLGKLLHKNHWGGLLVACQMLATMIDNHPSQGEQHQGGHSWFQPRANQGIHKVALEEMQNVESPQVFMALSRFCLTTI